MGKKATDPKQIKHLRSIATQYASMITSINELKYLRGLDFGEKLDPRDKIRATAARVGLGVPHVSSIHNYLNRFCMIINGL